ncbi:MAG: hypothetical protein ACLRWM_01940 [Streptococcus sp.]
MINIESDEAIAFTKELVKKYVTYFANANVSEIFNFGADEYANDVFSNPGWGELQKLVYMMNLLFLLTISKNH